jgi:hypothetical protein
MLNFVRCDKAIFFIKFSVLKKYGKHRENSAKARKSLQKSAEACESVQKHKKVCKSTRKCAKA